MTKINMGMLELFCGRKIISQEFKKQGFRTWTVDDDPQFEPDEKADILELDPRTMSRFDVIWASPPCTQFTVARIGRNWEKTKNGLIPKNQKTEEAVKLVEKVLEFIEVMQPKYYYIENPRGAMRKLKILENIPYRHTVTYCKYGENRMKPTDIWTNNPHWEPRPACKNGDSCHTPAPRGSRTGTQGFGSSVDMAEIPRELAEEIANNTKL